MKIESATENKETGERTYLVRDEKFLIQLYHTKFGWQCVQLNAQEGIVPPETVKEIEDKIGEIWRLIEHEKLDMKEKKEHKVAT